MALLTNKNIKRVLMMLAVSFTISPIILGFLVSFSKNEDVTDGLHTINLTLINYFNIFNESDAVFSSIFYTLVISTISSFIIISFSFFIGYFLSRYNTINNSRFIKPIYLAVFIYSIPSVFFATYWNFVPTTISGVSFQFIITHFNYFFPFVLFLTINYFKYVPFSFDRQSAIDGISTKNFIFKIILPYFIPVLSILFLIVFIIIFNDVLFSTYISTKENNRFIGHFLIEHFYNPDLSQNQFGKLSAYGMIISIFLIFVSFFIIKYYHNYLKKELKNNI